MLDIKELTAETAREIAKSKNQDVSLEIILSKIMTESEKGGESIIVENISEYVMAELRMRGFDVVSILYRNSFKISWR